MPIQLRKENFENFINKKLVLIDFWAPWCGPCRMLGPIIDEVEKEVNYVSFGKVNVDEENELANKYDISGIPTLIIFSEGKEIDKRIGFVQKTELLKWLEQYK